MTLKKITLIAALAAGLAAPALAADNDPLRQALEDSKSSGKGLTFLVNGANIAGVVVAVSDKYVLARSTAQGNIVIRLDRLDAVAGFVGATDKKP